MPDQLKTHEEFENCLSSNAMVVVDFTATWCGPCKRIAPIFAKLSEENVDVKFIKIDVDENAETASKCSITAMPTFKFYKNGEEKTALGFKGAGEDNLRKGVVALKAL